jgi:hypothetical protein
LTESHGTGSWQSTSGSSIISANVVQWNGEIPNNLVGGKVDANASVSATVTIGKVQVSGIDAGVSVNVSSVTDGTLVSADFGTDFYNKIELLQPRTVAVSAYQNFPQVTVSANLDKTNYTVSSGSVTTVTGAVGSVTSPVTVGTNNDKTGYTISAYQNFPSVNVSAVTSGTFVSADFGTDFYNKIEALQPRTIAVSAYQNFPSVNVSAVTNGTFVSADFGTDYWNQQQSIVNSIVITNPVTVSAYRNFPQVYVSANGDKTGYAITANTDKTGYSLVGAVLVSAINSGLYVGTSAYQNFPSVTVSANLDKTNYSIWN